MRHSFTLAAALTCVGLVGCSGETTNTNTTGGGGSSASGGTSGSSASGGGGGSSASGGASGAGGGASVCPALPPTNGAGCTPPPDNGSLFPDAAHCSWGDDPRPACRTTAKCMSDKTWAVKPPDANVCAAPPLPAACPGAPPTSGSTCSDATLACWYESGARCACSGCKGGSAYPVCQTIDPPEWACATPAAGCPSQLPQAGSSCDSPGASCGPSCELEIVCEGGIWKWRQGSCPICASPDTPIATPAGERSISELRAGDLVYSVDHDAIVAVPLARVASTPVANHEVLRVTLAGGRVLEISAGHPTAAGGTFAALRPGDELDSGHVVLSVERIPYAHARTFDILPLSSTGSYFAAGAEIGSSLAR